MIKIFVRNKTEEAEETEWRQGELILEFQHFQLQISTECCNPQRVTGAESVGPKKRKDAVQK